MPEKLFRLANEQRRKMSSFGGMKLKYLQPATDNTINDVFNYIASACFIQRVRYHRGI